MGHWFNRLIISIPFQMHTAWGRDSHDYLGLYFDPYYRSPHHTLTIPSQKRKHLVASVTAILSGIVVFKLGLTPMGLAVLLVTWCLMVASMIDIDHLLLPDCLTLPLLWTGLLLTLMSDITLVNTADSLLGVAIGYCALSLIGWAFKWITGKEGMGAGDYKLLAALGAWTGWQSLLTILFLASVAGLLAGLCLRCSKNTAPGQEIPFGPYLSIAGWLVLVFQFDNYLDF